MKTLSTSVVKATKQKNIKTEAFLGMRNLQSKWMKIVLKLPKNTCRFCKTAGGLTLEETRRLFLCHRNMW